MLKFIIILVHAGVDEGFLGDEALVHDAAEVVVPLDVTGAADDIFEGAGTAIVVGDGAGDGIVVVLEKFVGEHALLHAIEQALRMNEDEDLREAAEDGSVAFLRVKFENPTYRFDGTGGVKGGEDQVAGLCGFHAGFHRLTITDFSEENDVRCLPQHILEALAVGVDIAAHFLLGDDAG